MDKFYGLSDECAFQIPVKTQSPKQQCLSKLLIREGSALEDRMKAFNGMAMSYTLRSPVEGLSLAGGTIE